MSSNLIERLPLLKALNGPVLITGHTGFKGTWLTLLLESLGIEVIGYSLAPEKDSLFNLCNREGKIGEFFGDINNYGSLQDFVIQEKPQVVIHMAAQPLVIKSFEFPYDTFKTNALGTASILDIATRSDFVKQIAVVTTDKVYKNSNNGTMFKENNALEGKDPYSASKVAAEAAINAWQSIYRDKSIVALRSGNVIGGGDFSENRLIPDLIRNFKADTNLIVRNPNHTRPWQHVLDPLFGYLLAIEYKLNSGISASFNFGPSEESLTVREVIEKAILYLPNVAKINYLAEPTHEAIESSTLSLNIEKSTTELKWKAIWNQYQAIEKTMVWWCKVLNDGYLPISACKEDISDFITSTIS